MQPDTPFESCHIMETLLSEARAWVAPLVWAQPRMYFFVYQNAWLLGLTRARMGPAISVTWMSYSSQGSCGFLEPCLLGEIHRELLEELHNRARDCIPIPAIRDHEQFSIDWSVYGLVHWKYVFMEATDMGLGLPVVMRETMAAVEGSLPVGFWEDAPAAMPHPTPCMRAAGFTFVHGTRACLRDLRRCLRS
jgi:hypothetical protein